MYIPFKDVRLGDRIVVTGFGTGKETDQRPGALGPDDPVAVESWLGFPEQPHLMPYLGWLDQELAKAVAAVQKYRLAQTAPDETDMHFAAGDLKQAMESLRRVLDMVEFPVIRGETRGLR